MKTILVLVLAVGVVTADIGLGYHYKVPHTSYGVPSYQIGSGPGEYSTSYASNAGVNSNYKDQSNTGQYSSGEYQTNGGGYNTDNRYQTGSGGYNADSASTNYHQIGSSSGHISHGHQYQTSNQYQSSVQEKYNYNYLHQQPPQVYKHFYVHAAPEEPHIVRKEVILPPAQKHYKIIFIKAPSQYQSPQIIPIQNQNEEKTIVYVLVKKPEEANDVVLPKVEQKPPTKPEVYFIKYNNKDDSQSVINNIVKDYNTGNADYSSTYSTENNSAYASSLQTSPENIAVQAFGASETLGSQNVEADSNSSGNKGTIGINETSDNASGSASTVTYNNAETISTSQGIPHETYGPPKFRSN